jgi:tripartite-type tricarboxylate transporter receptor subunit TctC
MLKHILAASASTMLLATPAAYADDFYKGKTIDLVINLGAGGSTGVMAQLFSQYWSKHIPGNPQFVVTPVTGGAQLQGITAVKNARPDGLTVGWLVWSAGTRQIGPDSQKVDWSAFDPVAGVGAQWVAYMRRDVEPGMSAPEDIANAKGVQIGGYRPGSELDLLARMSLDLLGVEYGYTTGFKGGAEIVAAMQRDEINFAAAPAGNYFSNIKSNVVDEGIGLPLWYFALTGDTGELAADPTFGEIPSFDTVYRNVKGEAPSGELWNALQWLNDLSAGISWFVATPAGVESEQLETLRTAFAAAAADPEYLAEVEKALGAVPPVMKPARLQTVMDGLNNLDPNIITVLQDYIKSGS